MGTYLGKLRLFLHLEQTRLEIKIIEVLDFDAFTDKLESDRTPDFQPITMDSIEEAAGNSFEELLESSIEQFVFNPLRSYIKEGFSVDGSVVEVLGDFYYNAEESYSSGMSDEAPECDFECWLEKVRYRLLTKEQEADLLEVQGEVG